MTFHRRARTKRPFWNAKAFADAIKRTQAELEPMLLSEIPEYRWRGKATKSITVLCRRVDKAMGIGCFITFDQDAMHVRLGRNGKRLAFARTFDAAGNSIISDKPQD